MLIYFQGTGKWYELQDLHVKEIEPQMLTLTESYIQVSIIRALGCREKRTNLHSRLVRLGWSGCGWCGRISNGPQKSQSRLYRYDFLENFSSHLDEILVAVWFFMLDLSTLVKKQK